MGDSPLTDEVDRQLKEQRSHADALASRSGLMIAASALLATVLARNLQAGVGHAGLILSVLGVSAILGIAVAAMGRLTTGPTPATLSRWHTSVDTSELFFAKIVAVEANGRALVRTEVIFLIQAAATVVGIAFFVLSMHSLANNSSVVVVP